MIRSTIDHLMNLVFPRLCFMCMQETPNKGQDFCIACILNMPFTNHFKNKENDAANKFWGRLPYIQAASLLNFYSYTNVRWMMHRLKYEGRKDVGITLGRMAGKKAKASAYFKDLDIIIPVPLHTAKREKRGYNQAEMVAKGVAEILELEIRSDLLLKNIYTKSQTKMGRVERVKNVFHSFELVDKNCIQGRHILLVDDVLTTGATLEACARKLLEAKGVKISFLTACIAKHAQ